MLAQPRLRFLLADEPGTGKTIMTGMYIVEGSRRAHAGPHGHRGPGTPGPEVEADLAALLRASTQSRSPPR